MGVIKSVGQHPLHAVAAEDLHGLVPPGRALLGQRARLVLDFARFQRCLLGEGDDLDMCRFATMIGLKLRGE
ncbi:hypothetical protein, partial [Mycolicibacterium sphagni]|uniref:hypothetical protein n=1 Tax=Mycolicibacterium sphagni TaxID=1786 RepID=UPI0027E27F5D